MGLVEAIAIATAVAGVGTTVYAQEQQTSARRRASEESTRARTTAAIQQNEQTELAVDQERARVVAQVRAQRDSALLQGIVAGTEGGAQTAVERSIIGAGSLDLTTLERNFGLQRRSIEAGLGADLTEIRNRNANPRNGLAAAVIGGTAQGVSSFVNTYSALNEIQTMLNRPPADNTASATTPSTLNDTTASPIPGGNS
jgi:hypothetical protein